MKYLLIYSMLCNGKVVKTESIKNLDSKQECLNFLEGLKAAAELGNLMNPKRGKVKITGKCRIQK